LLADVVAFPDHIEGTVEVAHSSAKVWAALTTAEGLVPGPVRGHDRSAPGHIHSDQEFKAAVLHGLHRG
jgi:hypothetical protein